MKKILIVLICLMIIVGCEKKKNTSDNPAPTEEPKVEVKYYDEEAVQARLREIAEDVYEKKTYVDYEKVDGMYFISLKDLKEKLNYDTTVIEHMKDAVCNENNTGISVDVDNIDKVDYYGSPVITYMDCKSTIENTEQTE